MKIKIEETSYNLIQRVNKAGLTIVAMYFQGIGENRQILQESNQNLQKINQTLEKLTEQMRIINLNKGNK